MQTDTNALNSKFETKDILPSSPLRSRYARFGSFRLDVDRQELTQNGNRIKLQGKVYQILVVLIERPGEIVTRHDVCRRLWPEDLHVNFDANVNTTVNKLRQVLGDAPGKSTFIETIPRRGYSFIAPVQFSDSEIPEDGPAAFAPRVGVMTPPAVSAAAAAPATRIGVLGFRAVTLLFAGMLFGGSLTLFWYAHASRAHAAPQQQNEQRNAPAPATTAPRN